MVSTPTTRNRLNKQGTGDGTNVWGTVLNGQVFDLIDSALDGVSSITVSGNVTLTSTNYVSDQARMRFLKLSGAGGFTITIPSVEKWYWVRNACSAAVIFSSGGATVSVPAGQTRSVLCDGTDCFLGDDGAAKSYVDATFLPFTGGTLTGALTLNAAPTVDLHASTKKYVDDAALSATLGYPALPSNALKYLRVNAGETAIEWAAVDLSTYQPLDADLTAIAALTTAAYGRNSLTWAEATTSGNVNPCVVRTRYYVDSGTAARTLTLPAAPADGDEIFFADKDGNAGTNNFTIGRNGNTIAAAALDLVANVNNCAFMLRYRLSTTNWELVG
jgi:hypothetical protein